MRIKLFTVWSVLVLMVSACSVHAQSIAVRTTNNLSFLAGSLGADRLGSAKLGYLDSNVLLQVIDSNVNNYKVQLSKYHSAFIAKEDVKRDTAFYAKPWYLMNNIRAVGGTNCYDSIMINLDEKLPYTSYMEINPARIIIDIFGVQSNTNWITQKTTTLSAIKNIFHLQQEDDKVRVVVELTHLQHWGYTIYYLGNTLVVLVKHQPQLLKPHAITVAIDAGHGGSNTGATGITSKVVEKDYTLLFAKELEKYLASKNVHVIMTRHSDSSFGNTDRVKWLQLQHPDLLISLHLNSSAADTVHGTGTFYKHIGFRPLSQAVLKRMLDIGMSEYANVGNFNFLLNAPTDFPNVLLEIAFLSNRADEQKIIDPNFNTQVARQIYLAIADFLKEAE